MDSKDVKTVSSSGYVLVHLEIDVNSYVKYYCETKHLEMTDLLYVGCHPSADVACADVKRSVPRVKVTRNGRAHVTVAVKRQLSESSKCLLFVSVTELRMDPSRSKQLFFPLAHGWTVLPIRPMDQSSQKATPWNLMVSTTDVKTNQTTRTPFACKLMLVNSRLNKQPGTSFKFDRSLDLAAAAALTNASGGSGGSGGWANGLWILHSLSTRCETLSIQYDESIQKALRSLPRFGANAAFPDGTLFDYRWRESEVVRVSSFAMTKLMYFTAFRHTCIHPTETDAFSDHLVRFALVKEGISMKTFEARRSDPSFCRHVLARAIHVLPSAMLHFSSGRDVDYELPVSESHDLATAAVDCRELSSLCCLMYEYLSASSATETQLARFLKPTLAQYLVCQATCTVETGTKDGVGMHIVAVMILREVVDRLQCGPEVPGSDSKNQQKPDDSKTPPINMPACIIDATCELLPLWTGFDPTPIETASSFLHKRYSLQDVVTRHRMSSIICLYMTDDWKTCRQLFPVSFDEKLKNWSLGVKLEQFCMGIPARYRLWNPLREIDPQLVQLSKDISKEFTLINTMHFDPKMASRLTDEFVNANAVECEDGWNSWVLYSEKETGKSLQKRVMEEMDITNLMLSKMGSKHKIKAEVAARGSHYYLVDGLEELSLVCVRLAK